MSKDRGEDLFVVRCIFGQEIRLLPICRRDSRHFARSIPFASDGIADRSTVEYSGFGERVHSPEFNYCEFATIGGLP